MNLAPLVTLGVFLFILAIYYKMMPARKRHKWSGLALIGILLLGAGLYIFPAGSIDLYEVSRGIFDFTYLQNYFFWITVCTILMVVGFLLIKWRAKR